MANYGKNQRPADVVPDWLLGGNRKRQLLAALASSRKGHPIEKLASELGCGRTTAFETIRALRALGVIEQGKDQRVRLADKHELAKAIRTMLKALEPFADELVDRPPRPRGRP